MKNDLPYFSQWGGLHLNDEVIVRRTDQSRVETLWRDDAPQPDGWRLDGYRSREEYLFWSRRACGLACLQSLLHGWTDTRLSMGVLVRLARDRGCYIIEPSGNVKGLIYRPFMAWVESQFGFRCELIEHTPIEISAEKIGPGQVMIASVSPEIRDPGTGNPLRGGHLVLIHEVHNGEVRFHDPSGYSDNSASTSLPMHVFERFHADRGIMISRKGVVAHRTVGPSPEGMRRVS
ncbi:hypothetical protein [Nocardia thraciensis]